MRAESLVAEQREPLRAEGPAAEQRERLKAESPAPEPPERATVEGDSAAGGRLGVAHFVRGVSSLGAAQLASWAGSVVGVVLMPRFLGAAGLGQYAVAFSMIGLFLVVSDMGIVLWQAKEVAKDPEQASSLYLSVIIARLALAVAVALIAALTFHLLFTDPVIRLTGYVLSGLIITGAFQGTYATLQGLHRAPALGATTAVSALAAAALTAAVLYGGGGAVACAAAAVAGAAISQGVSFVLLLRHLRPRWSVSFRLMSRAVLGGIPFVLWAASMTAYSQIDVVMLNVMTRPDVVGWYAAALKIVGIPAFIPATVLTVAFPVLTASARNTVAFAAVSRQVLRVTLLLSLPLALGMAILPQDITHALRYPAEFWHAWLPLQLLAVQFPLVAADMVIGSALIALDKQRQWTLTAVSAAILNPLLNLWAIPFTQHLLGNGAVGAAAVTAFTELFMMCVGLWLLPREVFGWADAGMVTRILAACIPMAVVAYLLTGHFALAIPAAGLVYGVAAFATRAVDVRDLRALRYILPSRRAASAALEVR